MVKMTPGLDPLMDWSSGALRMFDMAQSSKEILDTIRNLHYESRANPRGECDSSHRPQEPVPLRRSTDAFPRL